MSRVKFLLILGFMAISVGTIYFFMTTGQSIYGPRDVPNAKKLV